MVDRHKLRDVLDLGSVRVLWTTNSNPRQPWCIRECLPIHPLSTKCLLKTRPLNTRASPKRRKLWFSTVVETVKPKFKLDQIRTLFRFRGILDKTTSGSWIFTVWIITKTRERVTHLKTVGVSIRPYYLVADNRSKSDRMMTGDHKARTFPCLRSKTHPSIKSVRIRITTKGTQLGVHTPTNRISTSRIQPWLPNWCHVRRATSAWWK